MELDDRLWYAPGQFHSVQQQHRAVVLRGDRLQNEVDTLLRSAFPYVSFVQRKYDVMHTQYI